MDMAANGSRCEQPQKRAGARDKQNGKSAGRFLVIELQPRPNIA